MALYDPPDGSADPRPRCVGHCCRGFSLEHPYARVQEEFARSQRGEATSIPDIGVIGAMLVPLGVIRKQELFTCRHLRSQGDCGIYEARPRMCRDFPGPKPCPYRNCASHGVQPLWKRAWNWIRD